MADVKPLKLVDQGGGAGRLEEFGAGDRVPAENLPATEWSAETVSQAEAEAGTETTRRAWTAQRVRQAIVAWWNGVTTAWGRGFVASANASAGRAALELGNAATRAVQTSPTDTTAGALMPVGAFGLGSPELQTLTDPDPKLATGFYRLFNSTSMPDLTTWTLLDVERDSEMGRAVQTAWGDAGGVGTWWRIRTGTGVWQPWRKQFDTGNILGPVSQSGGIPTGAIIERGNNANGEYVRYADGTQICWIEKTVTGLSTPVGGTWNTGTFYMPVAFVGQRWSSFELSAANAESTQTSYPVVNSLAGSSPSVWALTVYNAAGATIGVVNFAFICVGRWY